MNVFHRRMRLMIICVAFISTSVFGPIEQIAAQKRDKATAPATTTANATNTSSNSSPTTTTENTSPGNAQPANEPSSSLSSQQENDAAEPLRTSDDRIPFMADDRERTDAESPSTLGLLARTLGALMLIIGLIVAASWGIRRYGGEYFNSQRNIGGGPELAVLSTVSLGDRRSISAVRFGDRVMVVGSTPQQITLLADDDTYDNVAPPTAITTTSVARTTTPKAPPMRSVADMLNATTGQDAFEDELTVANERYTQHSPDSATTHRSAARSGGGEL